MAQPETVDAVLANERSRLTFVKICDRIIKELEQPKVDVPVITALGDCAQKIAQDFEEEG